MSIGSMIFRIMCTRSDNKRDKGLTTPPEVERFDSISYGPHKKWHLLDVYRPKDKKGKLPVIVSFHGGGFVYGTKETYQFYCMELARQGFAVINYNYRLAPKYRHPAALEDTNSVFSWLMKNSEKYGFDTDNIFAVGDSAGAQGIALYACILTSGEYAERYSFTPPEGLSVKGLALNCGIYDAGTMYGGPKKPDFIPKNDSGEALSDLTVIKHITKDFPPCYVMTSNADMLREESPKLVKKLEEKGVLYRYRVCGDDENQLGHVFHCNIRSEASAQANSDECSFFRELMQ
ncbi:MAG: alpha/beta hydrolase [Ruminococcus sp.]|nr:alpha/beta hydrolase [Ruminococcus sp.]